MKGKRAAPGPAESVRHRLKADVGLACSVRPGAALETGTVLPHVTGAKVPAPPARELRVVPRKVCLSSQLVGRKGFFIAQTGKRSWTMKSLEERDRALIEAAGAAIRRNYDGENFHHTVGAAVRCGSGMCTPFTAHAQSRWLSAPPSPMASGFWRQSSPSAAKTARNCCPRAAAVGSSWRTTRQSVK